MEGILTEVRKSNDGKLDRLAVSEAVEEYLPHASAADLHSHDADALVSELLQWVQLSNYKIALAGIQHLSTLAERLGAKFKHVTDLVPVLRERLGDTKEQVRDNALELLMLVMEDCATPREVFDLLEPGLSHRSWRARETVLKCFEQTLTKFGSGALKVSRLMDTICGLVSDSQETVREAAVCALVEVYRHVGHRVRTDINKSRILSPQKIKLLNERFDAVEHSGTMLASTTATSSASSTGELPKKLKSTKKRDSSFHRPSTSSKSGGISTEEFELAMAETEPLAMSSDSEMQAEIRDVGDVLNDMKKTDWETRVEALIKLRRIVRGSRGQPNLLSALTSIRDNLEAHVKTLRSGVLRDTCVSLAVIAEELQDDMDHLFDYVAPALFKQVIVNTKVMADAADQCFRSIIKSVYSKNFVKMCEEMAHSRSVVQRRRAIEYMLLGLDSWLPLQRAKNASHVGKYIAESIEDADSIVRGTARRAFWTYHALFPKDADKIFNRLDRQKQKLLQDEKGAIAQGAPVMQTTLKRKAVRPDTSMSVPRTPKASVPKTPRSVQPPSRGSSRRPPAQLHASGEVGKPQRVSSAKPRSSSGPRREASHKSRPSPSHALGEPRRIKPSSTASGGASSSSSSSARRGGGSAASSASSRPQTTSSSKPGYGDALAEVLALTRSSDWSERMQAITILRELLRGPSTPTPREIRKIASFFNNQFGEPHNKVFSTCIDTLCDFIVIYKADCPLAWLSDLLVNLLQRMGADLVSQTQAKILYALELLRESFDVDLQLSAVLRMLMDRKHNHKVKLAALEYIALLLPRMTPENLHAVYDASHSDARSGLQRIVEMSSEPRSLELRKMANHVVTDIFELEPRLFSRILAGMAEPAADAAKKILTANVEGWEELAAGTVPPSDAPSENGDGVDDDASSAYPDEDEGIPLDDEGVGGEKLISGGRSSEKENTEPGQLLNSLNRSTGLGYNPSVYQTGSETSQSLKGALAILNSSTETTAEKETTLLFLQKAASVDEDNITLANQWRESFDQVLEALLSLMAADNQPHVRDLAVRALRELIRNQTALVSQHYGTVLLSLLERHTDSEREVLRAAEDSLGALMNVMEPLLAVDLLQPAIEDKDGSVLLAAIRMLTKVVKRLDKAELGGCLERVLPGLFKGYKHTAAEIRKSVVFALVEMHLILGDTLTPHLSSLTSSQSKLLKIYIKRAEDKLAEAETF